MLEIHLCHWWIWVVFLLSEGDKELCWNKTDVVFLLSTDGEKK